MLRHLVALVITLGFALPVRGSGDLLAVAIHDVTEGRTLVQHLHAGQRYVAGRPGNDYHVVLRNPTGIDLLAVVSVDGVNVVTGQTASWEQSGYVVPAGGEVVVRGWRKSLSRVASFYFSTREDAYATRTGRPADLGVIGVAVFRPRDAAAAIAGAQADDERASEAGSGGQPQGEREEGRRRPSAAQAPSELGTGHGRSRASPARYAHFERATSVPAAIVSIRYDTHARLVAAGILRPVARRSPDPFPGQFVPDPR